MPIVYAYGRASTGRQTITEDAQRSVCEEYIKRALVPEGYTYGGWLYDSATSGTKPMFERDEGRKVWALVQPGDKIVWAKLDRAFRSVIDAAQTMQLLNRKDVSFNSLDLGLDTGSPIGRCVFTILTAFAELEVEFVRQRTREALRSKKAAGLPYGRCTPIGWRKVGKRSRGYFLPDSEERVQCDRIAALRQSGKSLDDIVEEMRLVTRPRGCVWNRNTVRIALRAHSHGYPKRYVGDHRSGDNASMQRS
jgi:DNA invertase Pin-like site-specific DNA recombinase